MIPYPVSITTQIRQTHQHTMNQLKKPFYPQESGRGWARKTWQLRLLTDMAFFG